MGMIIYQTPNCPHPPDLSAEMQWHLLWLLRNKIKAVHSRETTVYGAKLVKTTLEDTWESCHLAKKATTHSANPNPKVVWKKKHGKQPLPIWCHGKNRWIFWKFVPWPRRAPAAMSQSMALYFWPEIRMPQILGRLAPSEKRIPQRLVLRP